MSVKPEALRLAEELYAFHAAKKEMPSAGGQMLGLERYRIVATGEAFSQILDAADKLIRQHAEIERLRELVRHILGDRITPEAYLLFGKAWVDEAHAALRREPGDG